MFQSGQDSNRRLNKIIGNKNKKESPQPRMSAEADLLLIPYRYCKDTTFSFLFFVSVMEYYLAR